MRTLTAREKKMLAGMVILAVLVFGWKFVASPIMNSGSSGGSQITDNAGRMQRMGQLYDEYRKIRAEKGRYSTLLENKTEKTTELIQQCATSNNIDKNIGYTRKSQSNVQNKYIRVTTDVKFEGVAFGPLAKFIADMEGQRDLVRISYLRISKGLPAPATYDPIIQTDSFINK